MPIFDNPIYVKFMLIQLLVEMYMKNVPTIKKLKLNFVLQYGNHII